MKTFYVGVKAVIVKDGKVLLLRTNPEHEGRGARWEAAGGRIDGDETFQQTLTRELREELPNIQNIQIGDLVDVRRIHRDIWGTKSLTLIYFMVEADFAGSPELSEEHLEWKWADANQVRELVQDDSQTVFLKALQK